MGLLNQFVKLSPNKVTLSILMGAISGILQATLIPVILAALSVVFGESEDNIVTVFGIEISTWKYASFFACIVLLIMVFRAVSQILLSNVAIDLTSHLRKKLIRKVSESSLLGYEKVGQDRIFTGIITDVNEVVIGASQVPDLIKNSVSILGMLIYLMIINLEMFWYICISISAGVILFYVPTTIANKYFAKSRTHFDELQFGLKGILDGFKELKLSKSKREDYFKRWILSADKNLSSKNKRGLFFSKLAYSLGDMSAFVTIGMLTFVTANYHEISYENILIVIMTLIYITGPLEAVMHQIPDMAIANISLHKLNTLYDDLSVENYSEKEKIGNLKTLEFKDITFAYGPSENDFRIGPINFKIGTGELVFIVGGNGSGKSTVSKLITQHYRPLSGDILINGVPIKDDHVLSLRERVSSIYTDFHLFTHMLGNYDEKVIKQHLEDLGLSEKVTFENGKFSTVQLSDGQRKRLALLVALMDDRDIYLLDEWAADQDPEFKDVFYRKILMEMRKSGKIVIVISHDDHYFDVADKFLVMSKGSMKIVNPETLNDRNRSSMSMLDD